MTILLRHLELALRLQVAVPWLPPEVAYDHAAAATAAETEHIPAELLLGIAFVESRFDPTAVSRVEGHTRKTGSYRTTAVPPQLDRRASLFCGPLQTYADSWSACVGLRELSTAYAAGAGELRQWLRDPRVRGSTVRALAGHGCGNHGVATGACNGYPQRVLDMARRLRPAPPSRTQPAPGSVASS